jgi:aspartyl-tRNA(Asn)/glutamyl-tRNA(Gln) amidotransferase subunit A
VPLAWSHHTLGALLRDVRDAALLLQAVAVVDKRDVFSMTTPAPNYLADLEKGVRGVRMAWSPDFGRVIYDEEEIVPIVHETARAFQAMGANYSEPSIRLEDTMDPMEPDPEFSQAQVDAMVRRIKPDYIDPFTWASKLPREDYAKLSLYVRDRNDRPNQLDYMMRITPAVRYRKRDKLNDLFKRIDLLMSPVITRRAFICGEESATPWQYTAYTHLVNVTGYCAASVPAGFYKGMPVGLQIMGRPGEEALVLRAARALERERPWAQLRPKLA